MVRSRWIGALVAILACTAPSWGQVLPMESFITVREQGKPELKCRIVKCWRDSDGKRVCEVQTADTGETMTIVDEDGSLSTLAPKTMPTATPTRQRIFRWGTNKKRPAGAPIAPANAQVVSSWATPGRPHGMGQTGPTIVESSVEPPLPADLRASWGKVEHSSGTSTVKKDGDPLRQLDETVPPVAPITEPRETLPPSPPGIGPVVSTTEGSTCDACAPCVSSKSGSKIFPARDFPPTTPREGVMSRLFNKNAKPQIVKTAPVVKNARPGTVASTKYRQQAVASRSELPAGMGSVAAASSAAVSKSTPAGALVQSPTGQPTVVPVGPAMAQMPSIPLSASNAFTVSASGAMIPLVRDQGNSTLANAFTMPHPYRPVPADMMMSPVPMNAFRMQGMGGADVRPPMAMAMGYGYPQAMMGYYPVATMPHPGMMMPAGQAVAADMPASPAPLLATLRQALLPSEREQAAERLSRLDWKTDPQIVPALVMAAQADPSPMVRVACVRALGQLKVNTVPAVEAIQTLKHDKDARVRQEVEQVLPALLKR